MTAERIYDIMAGLMELEKEAKAEEYWLAKYGNKSTDNRIATVKNLEVQEAITTLLEYLDD